VKLVQLDLKVLSALPAPKELRVIPVLPGLLVPKDLLAQLEDPEIRYKFVSKRAQLR